MAGLLETLAQSGGHRCLLVSRPRASLKAIIALDSFVLGPAMGGIRTQPYVDDDAAMADAVRLASAMTLKCAIAGLDAGGAKTVVIAQPNMDRLAAFQALGEYIEELGGLYYAAGDLGTGQDDLLAAASMTKYVATEGADLADAAGLAVLRCIEACVDHAGRGRLQTLRVAVQGCGDMGAAVARAVAKAGAEVLVADVNGERARRLAEEVGATVADPRAILLADADVVAPCARGGVIDIEVARQMKAWAICGAANNQIADAEAERALIARGIVAVPDIVASAGAVIRGAAARGLGPSDYRAAIGALGATTRAILAEARASKRPPRVVAEAMARARIAAKRGGA